MGSEDLEQSHAAETLSFVPKQHLVAKQSAKKSNIMQIM